MRLFVLLFLLSTLVACSDSSRRPNQPPTLTGIADVAVQANVPSELFTVTLADDRTAALALDLAIESDNAELLPEGAITVTGTGANRVVAATPAAGQLGSATLTFTVSDAGGLSRMATALVSVERQQVGFSDVLRGVFGDQPNGAPRDLNSLRVDNDAAAGDFDDLLP